ncbi:hypothetical protein GTA69_004126 [Salmonella enterica]|nr:hypothetical protein [Salmonella enterica]
MTALNKQALIAKIKKQTESFDTVVLKEDEANALLGELEAAEKRIAELEARTVKLPAACADDEYFIDGVFQALRYERDVERALRAAGIGVKGE